MNEEKEICGILLVDKPCGITSHDVVSRVRRLYGTRRVGHTGTLDPMATGLLPVLVGRAAKAAEYLVTDSKRYVATLRLGLETDTEDTTGKTLTVCGDIPSAEAVLAAAQGFIGSYLQTPPMYSALKQNGKKLLDLARQGIEVERKPREIFIHNLTATPTESPCDFTLDVHCSSGTYIRTLCADIGKRLGCGGVMASLRRYETGGFSIESAHTLQDLEALTKEEREAVLLPVESLFSSLPAVSLPAFYEKLCRSGCEIYQSKIKTAHECGARVRLLSQGGLFFALGEVRDYPDGSAIKAIKQFDI